MIFECWHKYTRWFPTPYGNGTEMVRVCSKCGKIRRESYNLRYEAIADIYKDLFK